MSQLEQALAQAGLDVRVEVREGLALLVPCTAAEIATDQQRRAIVALVAEHGFTHVALELVD
ncbi:MAG: hypothetical protein ACT4P6_03005 [Gemmatimonadaceae bacterium]